MLGMKVKVLAGALACTGGLMGVGSGALAYQGLRGDAVYSGREVLISVGRERPLDRPAGAVIWGMANGDAGVAGTPTCLARTSDGWLVGATLGIRGSMYGQLLLISGDRVNIWYRHSLPDNSWKDVFAPPTDCESTYNEIGGDSPVVTGTLDSTRPTNGTSQPITEVASNTTLIKRVNLATSDFGALLPTAGSPFEFRLSDQDCMAGCEGQVVGLISGYTTYRWDLNGDGSYETSSLTTPRALATFGAGGFHSVGMRAENADLGYDVVATSTFPVTPQGETGVSIDDARIYTNKPDVQISLVWPCGTTSVEIANDGGFKKKEARTLSLEVPWKLASSGLERLPKIAYVRFKGPGCGSGPVNATFTDDIILDQTAPTLSSASGTTGTILARRGSAAALTSKPAIKLKLSATDKTSGVGTVQVTSDKTKAGVTAKYATSLTVLKPSTTAKTFYVRVKDKAGNNSSWKTITVK